MGDVPMGTGKGGGGLQGSRLPFLSAVSTAAVGQRNRGRNAEEVQRGARGGCDGGEEGVGKLGSVFSRERAASFWKEK